MYIQVFSTNYIPESNKNKQPPNIFYIFDALLPSSGNFKPFRELTRRKSEYETKNHHICFYLER